MNTLNFHIEQQICTEWCWAAVAAAVCACYNDSDAPDQRGVVSLVGGDPDCDCQQNPSLPCNQPRDLSSVLATIGHEGEEVPNVLFSQVTNAIDLGRPIVVRVIFSESAASGHAIAIYGYTDQGGVLIADPMNAGDKITVGFDDLVNGSSSTFHGTWQTAFLTIPK